MKTTEQSSTPELTLFYDGACHLCSREIAHYAQIDRDHKLAFVDISNPHFKAEAFGLDPVRVQQEIHIKTKDGRVLTAVRGFAEVWRNIPQYRWVAKVVMTPGIHALATVGYHIFARVRPYLPKRKTDDCESGTCYRKRS